MKKRLSIIHLDTDDVDNPLGGGQPVRTFEVNKRLALYHDISVCTSVFKGAHNIVKEGISYRRLGCYIKPLGLSPHISFLSRIGPHLLFTPHDLVIAEFMPPIGFSLLPFWTPKPVITIIQWYFFEFWEKKYKLPFKKIMKIIASCGLYKYFIVQTEAMGKEISKYIPDCVVRKIPCGINKNEIIKKPFYGDFVLFLGRLDKHQKGLDLLIPIWKKISDSEKLPLIIAGDGSFRNELEKRFCEAGIGDSVTFVGKVSGSEKKTLLATCRFLVMPSRAETFGITALEAMAASKPVVAFNIKNLNEVILSEWGDLAKPFNIDEFVDMVLNMWKNQDYCISKGIKGQKAATYFLWDNLSKLQNDFYENITKGYKV